MLTDVNSTQEDGNVVICLFDLESEIQTDLCRIGTIDGSRLEDKVFRLDGHHVWSRDYRKICFQAAPQGRRQVFMADVAQFM